ncbi:MAG TPA: hypothetical protein VFV99_32265 [Kofleriaceae bacterium]|nr:hypothetical protein [Kofleriaceae bacterium]
MREASRLPQPSIVDIDPEEPTQLLDDVGQYSVIDLDLGVEAQPHAEADALIDAAIDEAEGGEAEEEDELEARSRDEAEVPMKDKDTGDLYGVHQPPATDRQLDKTANQEVFLDADQGENWLETLGHKSVEYGPETEHQVDVIDDSDEHLDHRGHHASESGDRPVADKGSGGDGGL